MRVILEGQNIAEVRRQMRDFLGPFRTGRNCAGCGHEMIDVTTTGENDPRMLCVNPECPGKRFLQSDAKEHQF